MLGVLAGFSVIWVIILVGALVGRAGVLGQDGQRALSQFAFWVASPCLLFLTVARADVVQILSAPLLVAMVSAWSTALIWAAIVTVRTARARRLAGASSSGGIDRDRWADIILSGQTASQVNSVNLGIPLTTFVLGDPVAVVPVILFQLAINTPVYLTLMDVIVLGRRPDPLSILRTVLMNPMVMGSLLGVAVAASGITLPDLVVQPLQLIGGASIPCMLAAFGMSLTTSRPLQGSAAHRGRVALLSALKLVVQPLLAWLAGTALGLPPAMLFGVVIMAALPTAQNIYVAAVRYRKAEAITRDVVFTTSVVATGTMALVALLLGG